MTKVIVTIAHLRPTLSISMMRLGIVGGSALALIAAGRALPVLG